MGVGVCGLTLGPQLSLWRLGGPAAPPQCGVPPRATVVPPLRRYAGRARCGALPRRRGVSRLEQALTMQGHREADELAGRALGVSAHVEDEGLLQRRHHHRDQLEAAVRRLRSRSAEVSALHVNEDDSAEVPEVRGAAGRRRIEDLVNSVTEVLHVRHAELVSRHGE